MLFFFILVSSHENTVFPQRSWEYFKELLNISRRSSIYFSKDSYNLTTIDKSILEDYNILLVESNLFNTGVHTFNIKTNSSFYIYFFINVASYLFDGCCILSSNKT
jgi:hypothetical protein